MQKKNEKTKKGGAVAKGGKAVGNKGKQQNAKKELSKKAAKKDKKNKKASGGQGGGNKSKKSGSSLCGSLFLAGLVLTLVYLGAAMYFGMQVCNRSSSEFTSIPPLVAQHIGEGSYVPIHDGKRPVRVFVRKSGDVRGSEELVLLVHGVPSSSFMYRGVIDELTKRGVASIAFDFPGLGLSDKPADADYTWEYLAGTIKEVLDDTRTQSVHLVLHDIGVPVGLTFAAQHTGLVDSITLLNGPADLGNFKKPFPMNLLAHKTLGRYVMYAFASPLLAPINKLMFQFVGASAFTQEIVDSWIYLLTYKEGTPSFLKIMQGFNETAANAQRLFGDFATPFCNSEFGARCQLVEIDGDVISPHHTRYMVRKLGNGAKRGKIIRAKHFVAEEKPKQLAARIASFVNGLPPQLKQNKPAREVKEAQYEHVAAGSKYAMHDHSGHDHGHAAHDEHDGGDHSGHDHGHSH